MEWREEGEGEERGMGAEEGGMGAEERERREGWRGGGGRDSGVEEGGDWGEERMEGWGWGVYLREGVEEQSGTEERRRGKAGKEAEDARAERGESSVRGVRSTRDACGRGRSGADARGESMSRTGAALSEPESASRRARRCHLDAPRPVWSPDEEASGTTHSSSFLGDLFRGHCY
ncbi:unnamed protein product [Boreogadus saida]